MREQTKRSKETYYVSGANKTNKEDDFWIGDIDAFTSLEEALKFYLKAKLKKKFCGDEILAKEIYYNIVADPETMSARIVPVNDIDNNQFYYLIERFTETYTTYGGDMDGACHRTTEFKDWKNLCNVLLQRPPNVIVAKGLEVKLE